MTNYVANGLFLSKRAYTFTDERTGEIKDVTCVDVLVYDEIDKEGYASPRVVRVTLPTDKADDIVYNVLEQVKVDFSLSFDKKSGNLKPKAVGILPF